MPDSTPQAEHFTLGAIHPDSRSADFSPELAQAVSPIGRLVGSQVAYLDDVTEEPTAASAAQLPQELHSIRIEGIASHLEPQQLPAIDELATSLSHATRRSPLLEAEAIDRGFGVPVPGGPYHDPGFAQPVAGGHDIDPGFAQRIDVARLASDAQAITAHVSSGAALPEGLFFVHPASEPALRLEPLDTTRRPSDSLRDHQLHHADESHRRRYEAAQQQTGLSTAERVIPVALSPGKPARTYVGLQPAPDVAKLAQGTLERQRAGFELAEWRNPEVLAAITRGEQMRQFFARLRQQRSTYLGPFSRAQGETQLHPTPELLAAFKIEPISTGDEKVDFEQWCEYLIQMASELYGISPEELRATTEGFSSSTQHPAPLPADFYGPPTLQHQPSALLHLAGRPGPDLPQWQGLLNYPNTQAERNAAHTRAPRSLEVEAAEYLGSDLQLLGLNRRRTAVFETAQGAEGQERELTLCRYFCHILEAEPTPEDIAAFCELLNQYDAEGLFCAGVLSPVATVPLVSLPGCPSALVFFAGSACDLPTLKADTNGLARDEHELPHDVQVYLHALVGKTDEPPRPNGTSSQYTLAARAARRYALYQAFLNSPMPAAATFEQQLQAIDPRCYVPTGGNQQQPGTTSHLLAGHGFARAYPNLWERPTEYGETLSVHWLPSTGQWLLARSGATHEETLPPFYATDAPDLTRHLVEHRFSTTLTWPL